MQIGKTNLRNPGGGFTGEGTGKKKSASWCSKRRCRCVEINILNSVYHRAKEEVGCLLSLRKHGQVKLILQKPKYNATGENNDSKQVGWWISKGDTDDRERELTQL